MALDSHDAADEEELVEEQDDEDCSRRRRTRAMLLAFEHDEYRWEGCGGANDLARGETSRERNRAQVEERIMGLLARYRCLAFFAVSSKKNKMRAVHRNM